MAESFSQEKIKASTAEGRCVVFLLSDPGWCGASTYGINRINRKGGWSDVQNNMINGMTTNKRLKKYSIFFHSLIFVAAAVNEGIFI